MMTPPPNERDKETENAINEYLKKGGKITVCDEGARTENIDYKGSSFYGRKPKKKDSE